MSILEGFLLQGGRRRIDRGSLDLGWKTKSLRMELWSTPLLQQGKTEKTPPQGLKNSSERKGAERGGHFGKKAGQ